ncbi:cobalt-precorrin-6A reductase [Gandjariella thermophila]|uniref:Precorrin-6A reductase n=1 Tax=Gandjariella thermophila TaxID=1931992 RepID=A0A4D4J597_9PSEU|nr:cobalt-precorrin-6A reductase [Gandjariella thermophila]GDY29716.1 precorrin-6A reductase [Gandjariella thermophila]
MPATVLVLGGTAEARRLAEALTGRAGLRVVSSLAGRVAAPVLPDGEVRVGGFGGPEGLARWLRAERVAAVIDATHPFAAHITASAVAATTALGVPLLVLRRPGWRPEPGDDWRWVPSLPAAADTLAGLGERVFLSIGRQGLAAFAGLAAHWFLIRTVDDPAPPLPRRAHLLRDRGPYTVDGELELLRRHRIDVLVTKDSGGAATSAKLVAARRLRLPVLIVRRPPAPDAPHVETVAGALAWLAGVLG